MRSVLLLDHVLDDGGLRSMLSILCDSVELSKGEANQAVSSAGAENRRNLLGEFNCLVLDGETTDGD
jgi:hypothetical protein